MFLILSTLIVPEISVSDVKNRTILKVSAPTHDSAHHHQVKKGLLLWKLCVYDSLLARCGARAVSTVTGGICTSSSGVLPSFRA